MQLLDMTCNSQCYQPIGLGMTPPCLPAWWPTIVSSPDLRLHPCCVAQPLHQAEGGGHQALPTAAGCNRDRACHQYTCLPAASPPTSCPAAPNQWPGDAVQRRPPIQYSPASRCRMKSCRGVASVRAPRPCSAQHVYPMGSTELLAAGLAGSPKVWAATPVSSTIGMLTTCALRAAATGRSPGAGRCHCSSGGGGICCCCCGRGLCCCCCSGGSSGLCGCCCCSCLCCCCGGGGGSGGCFTCLALFCCCFCLGCGVRQACKAVQRLGCQARHLRPRTSCCWHFLLLALPSPVIST